MNNEQQEINFYYKDTTVDIWMNSVPAIGQCILFDGLKGPAYLVDRINWLYMPKYRKTLCQVSLKKISRKKAEELF